MEIKEIYDITTGLATVSNIVKNLENVLGSAVNSSKIPDEGRKQVQEWLSAANIIISDTQEKIAKLDKTNANNEDDSHLNKLKSDFTSIVNTFRTLEKELLLRLHRSVLEDGNHSSADATPNSGNVGSAGATDPPRTVRLQEKKESVDVEASLKLDPNQEMTMDPPSPPPPRASKSKKASLAMVLLVFSMLIGIGFIFMLRGDKSMSWFQSAPMKEPDTSNFDRDIAEMRRNMERMKDFHIGPPEIHVPDLSNFPDPFYGNN